MSTRAMMGPMGVVLVVGAAPLLLSLAGCAATTGAAEEATASASSAITAGTSVGTSTMVVVRSSSCVDVQGGTVDDLAPVIQYHCAGGANQQFSFVSNGAPNEFAIVAVHSGKCLDVTGASLDAGAALIQYACSGSANQTFVAAPLPDGSFQIVAKHSGMCLDVNTGTTADLAALIQYPCQGSDNEHFRIDALTAAPRPVSATMTIASGNAQSTPWYQASSAPAPENAGQPVVGPCPNTPWDPNARCVLGKYPTKEEILAGLPGGGRIYQVGFRDLAIKLVDAAGQPISGAQVTWGCGGGPVTPAIGVIAAETAALTSDFVCVAPSVTTATDANGIAAQPSVVFFTGFLPSALTVNATYGGRTVTFNLNATVPAPPPVAPRPPTHGPVNM